VAVLCALLLLVLGPPTSQDGGVTLDLDWDTCDESQWTSTGHGRLEAGGNPARQFTITSQVRRGSAGCAARFELQDDPIDVNSGFRSLWARYDSGEGTTGGDDFVYGLSFRLTTVPGYAHIWELHQRANLYGVARGLSIAPHALLIRDGALQYREMTGAAMWEGSRWTGWSNYQDRKVLIPALEPDTWYDVLVRIRTSETPRGLTQVYARRAGEPWPSRPTWENAGPSLPYIPGGLDPRIPEKLDVYSADATTDGLTGLYVEAGLYTGSSTWAQPTSSISLYLDQLRRYTDLAAAREGFLS
jgi:hypothetical protein